PFASGTAVTLTATPAAGSTFTGWSGGCTGTANTCTVTMSAAQSVTATFTLQPFTLTLTKAGTRSGTLTSTPTRPPLRTTHPPPPAPPPPPRAAPQRPRGHVARHAGRRLDLHRLERWLHRHRHHLPRHDERRAVRDRDVHAPALHAHPEQRRHRIRHRHQHADRHLLRHDLLPALRYRHPRDVDPDLRPQLHT